jgi:hypothetical protein
VRARLLLILAVTAVTLLLPHAAAAGVTWCGSGEAADDRLPDATAGLQFHAVYAIPSDGGDHFPDLASKIATDLAAVDEWWRREDPTRTPRFDFLSLPGCSGFGALDISVVRLPHDQQYYFAFANRYVQMARDLALTPLASTSKKYVVWYDGAVEGANVCGQSYSDVGYARYSILYMNVPRCGAVGGGIDDYAAKSAAHEMAHSMGAVPLQAPHLCPDGSAHTCDAGSDLMHGLSVSYPSLREVILDVNRDDYYRHGGSWFDLSTSPWLRHLDVPLQQLSVAVSGGAGTVEASQPGGACTATCSTAWETGTALQLAATPGDGQRFVGWQGACSGDGPCQLTLDKAQQVTAVFGPAYVKLSLKISGAGSVRVEEEAQTCRKTCALDVSAGISVALTAKPAKGWRFVRFTGGCTGMGVRCSGPADAPLGVTAVFVRRR